MDPDVRYRLARHLEELTGGMTFRIEKNYDMDSYAIYVDTGINYEQDSNILNVIDAIKSYKDNHKISSECISFAKEELNLENSNIKYKIIYDKILNE